MSKLPTVSFELTRWLAPFSAIVFFIFFGFAEAKKHYSAAILALLKRFGIGPPSCFTSSTSTLKSQVSKKASFTSSSKYAFPFLSHIDDILIFSLGKLLFLHQTRLLPLLFLSIPLLTHFPLPLSVFKPPEYKFDEHAPSTYVLDGKAPEKVQYDIESALSPSPPLSISISGERTFLSALTMFSADTSSRRYTM
jgi:hypothetical protein